MKNFKNLLLLAIFPSVIVSCKKEDTDPHDDHDHTTPVTYGSATLKFKNMVGIDSLVLNTGEYTNMNGDTFNVSTFNYYISNIKLTATDNSVYTETESYHLLKADDAGTLEFNLASVPAKSYSSISFMIGVDSTRNVSGAQTGALDPSNGMFWSWNSGYIMAKFEGTSPQSSAMGNMVMYHVGGFTGPNSSLQQVTINFPSNAVVTSSTTPKIFFNADLNEWFSPNAVSFNTLSTIHMPGSDAKMISDNYANMFSFQQIIN